MLRKGERDNVCHEGTSEKLHYPFLTLVLDGTRVAQKAMPTFFFLGNSLLRMYDIHAQYNWMFSLHM